MYVYTKRIVLCIRMNRHEECRISNSFHVTFSWNEEKIIVMLQERCTIRLIIKYETILLTILMGNEYYIRRSIGWIRIQSFVKYINY